MIDAQQFSLRFRLLMSYHDLTLRDIAKYTENAVSTVGTWKNGRVPSSSRTHSLLASLFGVSVEFLLHGHVEGGKNTHGNRSDSILEDIEKVLREIDGSSSVCEPVIDFQKPVWTPVEGEANAPYRRSRIEGYLRQFLDRAEAQPGGLAHTWYHLKREFPLDLFSRLS